jgi:FtsZ-binding cell division protein ZapB
MPLRIILLLIEARCIMAETPTLEALRADTDRLTKQVGRDRQIAEDRAEALRQELKGIKDEVRGYRQELRGNLAAFEGRFSSVEGQIYGLNAEVREVKNELADFREEVRQLFGKLETLILQRTPGGTA